MQSASPPPAAVASHPTAPQISRTIPSSRPSPGEAKKAAHLGGGALVVDHVPTGPRARARRQPPSPARSGNARRCAESHRTQLVLSRIAFGHERAGQKVGQFLPAIADARSAAVVDLDDGPHAQASARVPAGWRSESPRALGWSALEVSVDLARPAVRSEGRGEVDTVAVGDRVCGDAGTGEVRLDRCVHLLVGDGLGLKEFADGGESAMQRRRKPDC